MDLTLSDLLQKCQKFNDPKNTLLDMAFANELIKKWNLDDHDAREIRTAFAGKAQFRARVAALMKVSVKAVGDWTSGSYKPEPKQHPHLSDVLIECVLRMPPATRGTFGSGKTQIEAAVRAIVKSDAVGPVPDGDQIARLRAQVELKDALIRDLQASLSDAREAIAALERRDDGPTTVTTTPHPAVQEPLVLSSPEKWLIVCLFSWIGAGDVMLALSLITSIFAISVETLGQNWERILGFVIVYGVGCTVVLFLMFRAAERRGFEAAFDFAVPVLVALTQGVFVLALFEIQPSPEAPSVLFVPLCGLVPTIAFWNRLRSTDTKGGETEIRIRRRRKSRTIHMLFVALVSAVAVALGSHLWGLVVAAVVLYVTGFFAFGPWLGRRFRFIRRAYP